MGSFGGGGAKPGRRGGVCACMEGLAAPWRLRRAQLQPTALLGAAEPPPAASSATPGSSKIPPTRRSRLTTPTPPPRGGTRLKGPAPRPGLLAPPREQLPAGGGGGGWWPRGFGSRSPMAEREDVAGVGVAVAHVEQGAVVLRAA